MSGACPARWLFEQTESDQLFLSWPVDPEAIADRIPAPLRLDTFEGHAWITVVAFRVSRLRLRGLPPVPGLGRFGEVSCLTCVRHGEERAVWFLRIDAGTRVGSAVGRLFALPYRAADVRLGADGPWRSARSQAGAGSGPGAAAIEARYRPIGPEHEAAPGSLAHFLIERFVMFSRTAGGTLLRGEQLRAPRRIQTCEVSLRRNTLPEAIGVAAPTAEPVARYCARTVVRTWPPATIAAAPAAR